MTNTDHEALLEHHDVAVAGLVPAHRQLVPRPPSGARRAAVARTSLFLPAMLVAALLLPFFVAGCGTDDADETGSQPGVVDDGFRAGDLAALPLPPAAEPVTPARREDGVTSQSFQVAGFTAEQILEHFAQELPAAGWEESQPPERVGSTDWQGEWTMDGQLLEVSAAPFAAADGEANISQFSLVLHDRP